MKYVVFVLLFTSCGLHSNNRVPFNNWPFQEEVFNDSRYGYEYEFHLNVPSGHTQYHITTVDSNFYIPNFLYHDINTLASATLNIGTGQCMYEGYEQLNLVSCTGFSNGDFVEIGTRISISGVTAGTTGWCWYKDGNNMLPMEE